MAKDEAVFLPIWLRYYSRHFAPCDIYVLDHASCDGSIELARREFRFNCVRLDYEYFCDFHWCTGIVMHIQQQLLKRYRCVLFTDPDEIVYHREGLRNYIEGWDKETARCTGWGILHQPDQEAAYDPRQPVLRQRRFWHRHPIFDKPLLARVPLQWCAAGFHRAWNEGERDENLLLIHLHRIDYLLAYEKNRRMAGYRWSPEALRQGWGAHARIIDEEQFKHEYFIGSRQGSPIEPIPAELREREEF